MPPRPSFQKSNYERCQNDRLPPRRGRNGDNDPDKRWHYACYGGAKRKAATKPEIIKPRTTSPRYTAFVDAWRRRLANHALTALLPVSRRPDPAGLFINGYDAAAFSPVSLQRGRMFLLGRFSRSCCESGHNAKASLLLVGALSILSLHLEILDEHVDLGAQFPIARAAGRQERPVILSGRKALATIHELPAELWTSGFSNRSSIFDMVPPRAGLLNQAERRPWSLPESALSQFACRQITVTLGPASPGQRLGLPDDACHIKYMSLVATLDLVGAAAQAFIEQLTRGRTKRTAAPDSQALDQQPHLGEARTPGGRWRKKPESRRRALIAAHRTHTGDRNGS